MNKLKYGFFLLVAGGWVLNIKYYISRFGSEGFADWLSWFIAITLVVFSSIVFIMSNRYNKQKDKTKIWITRVLWVCLSVYSINATIAGQYWDQQQRTVTDTVIISDQENKNYWFDYYTENLKDLKAEYKNIDAWKNESITNLSERFYYKNTTKTVNEEQQRIKKEIAETEKELKELTKDNKISATKQKINYAKNIYQFYNKNNPEIVQFVFQLMLSVFIELIAPMSLLFFVSISYRDKKDFRLIDKSKIKHFALIAWYNIQQGKGRYLLPKETIIKYAKNKGIIFTEKDYNMIIKQALKEKLIKASNGKYVPYTVFIDSDYFIEKLSIK